MKHKGNTSYLRAISLFLCFLLVQSGYVLESSQPEYEVQLKSLIQKYNRGLYKELISNLEKVLNEVGEENSQARGKFFLLLGAAYEKVKNKNAAVENYLLGDMLLDDPELEGIDFHKMEIYQSTFHGKIINGRRVYEKVGKRKRKKRFPYLAVLGAAAVVVAVVILMKKKTKEVPENPEQLAAQEVFNSMEWIDIPAGEFTMGDTTGEGEADERPVHTVYTDAYKISRYELTWKQYRTFLRFNDDFTTFTQGGSDDHPVVRIRREEVYFFCDWVRKYTNKQLDLPTEAQWEKAARGTDMRIYPWGNTPPDCTVTNYNNCSNVPDSVGSYPADISFYGVMDMGGNVAEMIRDYYQEDYYSISPYSNPTGPAETATWDVVVRGSSFSSSIPRASNRMRMSRGAGYSNHHIGLRLIWIN